MEYVPNTEYRTLYPLMKPNDIKWMILQVLRGLNFAHSRGIIHRDIKPGTVLMNIDEKG